MKDSKLTLYNVEWQALRISLLGNWTTVDGTIKNIRKLNNYLTNSKSRLWRVLNLLNATRMGYSGQGLFNSKQSVLVKEFQQVIQRRYKKSTGSFDVDSESKIKADWLKLNDFQKKAILRNLKNRLKLHSKSKHRDELRWFLKIVDNQ